jgi:hypothetical protein
MVNLSLGQIIHKNQFEFTPAIRIFELEAALERIIKAGYKCSSSLQKSINIYELANT